MLRQPRDVGWSRTRVPLACLWLAVPGCAAQSSYEGPTSVGEAGIDDDTSGGGEMSGEDSSDEGSGGSGGPEGNPSPGCGLPPAPPPSSVSVDGSARSFILELPVDYDQNRSYPLIFGWHGTGHQAADARAQMRLMDAAQSQAIIVYPNGAKSPPVWQIPGGAGVTQPDRDIRFFDALVQLVGDEYCVDGSRIFSTGFSQGAYLSNALGCERPWVLRGIAPVAGGGPWGCDPSPMSAMVIIGKGDAIAHENGDYGYNNSAQRSRDFWLQGSGCAQTNIPADPYPCVRHDCPEDTPVLFCEHPGGHGWWKQASTGMMWFFSACRARLSNRRPEVSRLVQEARRRDVATDGLAIVVVQRDATGGLALVVKAFAFRIGLVGLYLPGLGVWLEAREVQGLFDDVGRH